MMSQSGGMDVNTLMQRVRRLITLDTSVFDEVRGDSASTIAAAIVAVVSILLFALGGWLWWIIEDLPDSGDVFLRSVIIGTILTVVLWGVAIAVTYVMLAQVFRARADMNELIRVMGFATVPLAIGVLLLIPSIGFAFGVAAVAITFALSVIAAQSATDAPAGRVLASVSVGFLVWLIVLGLFASSSDPGDAIVPNIFLFENIVDFFVS